MLDDIEPIHWNAIIESMRAGSCVPFLGAGVNVSNAMYKGLPLANDVSLSIVRSLTTLDDDQLRTLIDHAAEDTRMRIAQTLASAERKKKRKLNPAEIESYLAKAGPLPNLLRASLPELARVTLQVEVEAGFPYLLGRIREILADAKVEPSPMLKALASMRKASSPTNAASSPFQLIVTTNYDNLLERAFGKKPYELVIQSTTGVKDKTELQRRLSKPKGPIIYKIHGSFSNNGGKKDSGASDRLILTEEDYIEFLSIVGRKDKGVPPLISAKMVKGTILFLGYGLQDWDFRTIYKTMIEPIEEKSRPQSFAIQKKPPKYLAKYWAPKGVTILDVDLYEFAKELQARWNKKPA